VPVAPQPPAPAQPGIYFFHTDQVGAPQAVTAIDGSVVWSADWEPFGTVAIGSGQLTSHLRFPGQYFDEETGLHYNYYRHYDPTTGRYIESDPIGLRGGLNTFAYVDGDPLLWSDFYGLKEGSVSNLAKRRKIDELARGYDGSGLWATDKRKDNFPAGSWKCNKFVYDVTKEAGAEALTKASNGKMRPPLAMEYRSSSVDIPNWRPLKSGEEPKPGDIAAIKNFDGSHHSGLIISCTCKEGKTNISSHEDQIGTSPGQFIDDDTVEYRRYTGE